MSVRLVITFTASPGRGAELGEALAGRCREVAAFMSKLANG